MDTLAASPLDDVKEDLRLVRNQVDGLRLTATESKRPWWRQVSTMISLVGLTLSALFSVMTTREQYKERQSNDMQRIEAAKSSQHANALDEQKRRLDLIDESLAEIIGIRTEDTKEQATLATTNSAAYVAWNSVVNLKRMMLLHNVISSVALLPDKVSPTAYLILGNEMLSDGRYVDAERFITRGLSIAQKQGEPVEPLSGVLAQIYLLPGSPLYNPTLARATYTQTITSLSGLCDFNSLNTRLKTTLAWSSNEATYGDRARALTLLALARRALSTCDHLPEAGRTPLVTLIKSAEVQMNKHTLFNTASWLGAWRIFKGGTIVGTLTFYFNPGSPFANFTKQEISSETLVERQTGIVLLPKSTTMKLDWNSSWAVGPGGPYTPIGFSQVRVASEGSLSGHDYLLNARANSWYAERETH